MALEVARRDYEASWSQTSIDDQARDNQHPVVDQAFRPDHDVNLAIHQGGAALRLHRQISAIGQSMNQGINATVGDRQKDVELPTGLLGQQRPLPELEYLARGAR